MFRRSRAYTTIIVKFFVLSIMFCVMCREVKGLPSSTEECLDGICKNSMLTETPPGDQGNTKIMQPSSSTLPLPSMSMISENVHTDVTDVPPAPVVPLHIDEKQKGRAINFTLGDSGSENIISPNGTIIPNTKIIGNAKPKMKDISDVSMDDDDEDIDSVQFVMTTQRSQSVTMKEFHPSCEHNGKKYKLGEKAEIGCDETCICEMNGKMNCKPRCTIPFFRKGRQVNDPLCTERDVEDPCCAILVCAADTATEPLEMCSYKNKTYARGENFDEGCLNRCKCEHSGNVVCKPRCAPVTNKTSDRCVTVPDPKDSCCKLVLCDVTLNEHEKDIMTMSGNSDLSVKITSVTPINSTSVQLNIEAFSSNVSLKNVEVSEDKEKWITKELLPENIINGLKNGSKYFIKIGSGSNIVDVVLPVSSNSKINETLIHGNETLNHGVCKFKDNSYKIGEEFHDGCVSYCLCTEQGVTCDKIECPTNFGLDVLDPHCLEWETVPSNFVPIPPHCCAERMQCKNNGSCTYEDKMYANFAEIPINITGCHKRCYCEMGSVTCQDACPPVTAQAPPTLPCKPDEAILSHLPDDDCCLYWICHENKSTNGTQSITKQDGPSDDSSKSNKSTTGGFLLPTPLPPQTPTNNNKNAFINTSKNNKTDVKSENNSNQDINPTLESDALKPHSNLNSVNENKKHPFKFVGPLAPDYQDKNIPSSITPRPTKPKPSKTTTAVPFITKPPHKMSPFPGVPQSPYQPQVSDYFNNIGHGLKIPNSENQPTNQNHYPTDLPKRTKTPTHNVLSPEEILHLLHQQHPSIIQSAPPGTVIKVSTIPLDHSGKPLATNLESQLQHSLNIDHIHPNTYSPYQTQNVNAPPINIEQFLHHINNKNNNNPSFNSGNIYHNVGGGDDLYISQPFDNRHPQQQPQHINLTRAPGFISGLPGNFPVNPNYNVGQDEIIITDLEALNEHTVRLVFTVPPVIVGLHGRVELRYTDQINNDNPASWELQVFAPPNDYIGTQQLEFELPGLLPNTEYKIKITVILRDLHNTPSSRIYRVRTLPPVHNPETTLPPIIPINPSLSVGEVNATWMTVTWRKFTDYELQFIDGVQLRYKEINGMVYAATPLIHRAVTSYTIENLKANTEYEVGIYFIPFHGQQTELQSENMLRITTPLEIDLYGFNVTLEINLIKATSVEISWSGVPYPEDKYVNIYRAIYQTDFGKEDFSTFKIAKRDSPTKTTIFDLKPSTNYRLWLEVYLTNGKIKTSNVKDFTTKDGVAPSLNHSTQQGKLAGVSGVEANKQEGDYYGPLVVVAIIAAIAIFASLVLTSMLMKRHGQNKAAITTPSTTRVSPACYNNPTYKVEIQQETMNL